ncbi:hypothetical protein ACFSUD_13255 [Sulfitobacter aestuarii]|uniref:Uncharacterized protein n=1 Tax=Sulfitobacter aestuarii TaxID=2161676 RepID=A0ABW5U4A0_9RHOB
MSEKLDTSSEIVIFGRVVEDLSVKGATGTTTTGTAADAGDTGDGTAGEAGSSAHAPDRQFVRAYGFSFDGIYYEVPTPVLFLLKGAGIAADKADVPGPNPRNKEFFAQLKAWRVRRSDDTVRLDVDSGKFEHLLLDPGGEGAAVSGARVSGARVSGARVSGARVSGARVSGARVSGARDASD